jgi:FtsP/CotA-like multicopper oxidase with cupredoxin domain
MLNGGEVVKIILRMTDYTAGANAPYMFHCHILEHEDRGMMGQFTVI